MAKGRTRVYNTVHLTEEEREMFKALVAEGVNVYIQAVPEDTKMPIVDAISKMH